MKIFNVGLHKHTHKYAFAVSVYVSICVCVSVCLLLSLSVSLSFSHTHTSTHADTFWLSHPVSSFSPTSYYFYHAIYSADRWAHCLQGALSGPLRLCQVSELLLLAFPQEKAAQCWEGLRSHKNTRMQLGNKSDLWIVSFLSQIHATFLYHKQTHGS